MESADGGKQSFTTGVSNRTMPESASRTSPIRDRAADAFVAVEMVNEKAVQAIDTGSSGTPIIAELVPENRVTRTTGKRSGRMARGFRAVFSAVEWVFGCLTLIGGLAVLATIPVVQLLSLGYLLEVSGRIVREQKLRAGFAGVRKAARVGGIVLAVWLLLWPLRLVSSLLSSSIIIDPDSPATRNLWIALVMFCVLFVGHVTSALWRGGRLRSFLWPAPVRFVKNVFSARAYAQARDDLWRFIAGLRLPYYFWLGARGFAGGLLWLALPVTLLAWGRAAPLVGLLGGLLLLLVVLYLPFLQTRFAVENRFRAMFEVRAVRRVFARAPLAFFVALLITLSFALPLYLLKIEITPREAAWLPSLLFVAFIFPARMLTGWAFLRGSRRASPRHWLFRHCARLLMLPVVGVYALVTFSTQYVSWYGIWSLYEQHAFLLPVPFLGM